MLQTVSSDFEPCSGVPGGSGPTLVFMSIPILSFCHWAVHVQCKGSASAVHGQCMGSAWNYNILKLVLGSLGLWTNFCFHVSTHFGILALGSARAVQGQCKCSAWGVHGQYMEL